MAGVLKTLGSVTYVETQEGDKLIQLSDGCIMASQIGGFCSRGNSLEDDAVLFHGKLENGGMPQFHIHKVTTSTTKEFCLSLFLLLGTMETEKNSTESEGNQ